MQEGMSRQGCIRCCIEHWAGVGQGRAGRTERGSAGSGRGRARRGRAGHGRAGQDGAGQDGGRAWQGKAGQAAHHFRPRNEVDQVEHEHPPEHEHMT